MTGDEKDRFLDAWAELEAVLAARGVAGTDMSARLDLPEHGWG